MIAAISFNFARPWWLLACATAVPLVWMSWRNLRSLGQVRRVLAVVFRVLCALLLGVLLARPMLSQTNEQLTLIAVLDRSESVQPELQRAALEYLGEALGDHQGGDRLAVVDVAETASISKLPGGQMEIRQRNITLSGAQSNLAKGVQMALAIAPPDTAVKVLLVSDGNETAGDLIQAARVAAANDIRLDVLPLRYDYQREVVLKRLGAPPRARPGQTIPLRFVLHSTGPASGKLMLSLNGSAVDLDPSSAGLAASVTLKAGTNVRTVSLPIGVSGTHEFEATFIPDSSEADGISQNNLASAITFVAGPGRVLVVDADGLAGADLSAALAAGEMAVEHVRAAALGDSLVRLADADAIVLVDVESSHFTYAQQEMISRYVTELGGGLCVIGGPSSFGAGGWIGSPMADILPLDLDPPQKKQMPKGALVLIMHACEMPRGNYWGKRVATAAARSLSRLDLVGVLDYSWESGDSSWVYPLGPVGDKTEVVAAINEMIMGDMPDLGAPMQAAYDALSDCGAGQKHVIIISDGDPASPSAALLKQMAEAGITCTGVAVFPHSPADVQSLQAIAQATSGRFYNVQDPSSLPRIFVKEAQVVRRALILEETFTPQITYSLSEVVKGLAGSLPQLDGYVITGPKGGLSQLLLVSHKGDPVMATGQFGLGRCVAFTSSADSRWAARWLGWGGFQRFWEQAVRWASKSAQSVDCEVYADVEGRDVHVTVETVDADGNFTRLTDIAGQYVGPDMAGRGFALSQVGPGRYRGQFRAGQAGSYLVLVRYRRAGAEDAWGMAQSAVTVPYAPEFRDLSDNASLLREVAEITGGRVIGGEPGGAALFDRAGLKFPRAEIPLTKPLLLAWVVLFLLDVAVRRIAVDLRAMVRRVSSVLRRRAGATAGATVDRLKLRREQLKEQLRSRGRGLHAAKRYEYKPSETDQELRIASQAETRKDEPDVQADKSPPAGDADAEAEDGHLQRLLKIKRKGRTGRKSDQGEQD